MQTSWIWRLLSLFGLGSFATLKATLLIVGLDNAGKTTLLNMLKTNHLQHYAPTMHPSMEEVTIENVEFKAWDLGGHEQARRIWAEYYSCADAIVFVCDASDQERFEEARVEFEKILADDTMQDTPILVLGNKIDAGGVVNLREFRDVLGLSQYPATTVRFGNGIRPIDVVMCSVRQRFGFQEGFQILSANIRALANE